MQTSDFHEVRGGMAVDFTPGERAILSQLRELYATTARRDHALATITAQWPPMHYEAYRSVLAGLLSKNLLQASGNKHAIRITDAGLKAMGVTVPIASSRPQATALKASGPTNQTPQQASLAERLSAGKARSTKVKTKSVKRVVGGLVIVAIIVCAGWLFWRLSYGPMLPKLLVG